MLKRTKIIYLVSFIFAIIMGNALVNDLLRIKSIQTLQKTEVQVKLGWVLSQADKEARTFLQNVSYFHLENTAAAKQHMLTSFDILWSRYEMATNKQISQMLHSIPEGAEMFSAMRITLRALDPLVSSFQAGDKNTFDKINQLTNKEIDRGYSLSVTALKYHQSVRSKRLRALDSSYDNLLIILFGLMLVAVTLTVLFVLRSRELKNQNTVFEQRVKDRTDELNKTNQFLLNEAQIRKKVDQKSQQLISAFNQSKEIVFFLDADNRFIFFNKSFQLQNANVKDFIAIGDPFERYLQAVVSYLQPCMTDAAKQHWIDDWLSGLLSAANFFEVDFSSGQQFIFNIDRLEDGSVICIGAEISSLKATQKALAKSESRFREFSLIGADWYWEMDAALTFTYFAGGAEAVSGFSPDYFIGKSRKQSYGIVGKANKKSLQMYLAITDERKSFHDVESKWKTGHENIVTISLSGVPQYDLEGNFTGYIGAGRDVTERCLVEERDIRFLTAINSLNLMVTIYDDTDNLVFYNQEFQLLWDAMGLNIELGTSFTRLWSRISAYYVEQYNFNSDEWFEKRLTMHRKSVKNFVLPLGQDKYLNIFEQTLDDGGVIVISADISESKKAEQEIDRLRHYMASIIDSMSSVLIAVDTQGRIIQWNLAAQSETGISPERAYQKKLTQIFPRLEADMRKISDAISLGKESSQRKRMYIKNQVTLYEDITIYPLISGTEAGAGAVIRLDNVTEQVMISEMMIQSEKMLSLGGLAAGMAHEINNPLAGMMQTANVVLNRLGNHDVIASTQLAAELGTDLATINQYMERRGIVVMLNNIIASGHRIALIVDNMLAFSRQNQALSAEHSIIHLLNQALELSMTDHSLKHHYDFKNIVIVKEYQLDLPLINCEAGKIQQVFLNLLRNAAQAMQEDGVHKPQLILRINYDDKLKQVMIEIEDNGPGINDEVKLRVFDPFFTTKSEGLGTGLGLSVSYFIITENHGGKLTVDSVVGEYTKFIICLPLTGKKAP